MRSGERREFARPGEVHARDHFASVTLPRRSLAPCTDKHRHYNPSKYARRPTSRLFDIRINLYRLYFFRLTLFLSLLAIRMSSLKSTSPGQSGCAFLVSVTYILS